MMPAWLSVPLILSVAAAALAGAGALVVVRLRKPELRRLLAAADAALAARNPARAANLYRRAAAAADHDRTGSQSPEFPELRRRAYVGMGAALASANRRTEAFDAFQRARSAGIELPAEAQILIAERYVESGDRGPEAFEAYLGYVRIGPPSGAYGAAMCALVQQICEVQETMKSADRNLAVERNRRALAFNPNSEWAHYNLGLASLLAPSSSPPPSGRPAPGPKPGREGLDRLVVPGPRGEHPGHGEAGLAGVAEAEHAERGCRWREIHVVEHDRRLTSRRVRA